jgi:hypothetical protein
MRAAAVRLAIAAILLPWSMTAAQQSASFDLSEHVFNAGGRPAGGQVATSAAFQVTLDAIGDAVTPGSLAGGAFQLGGGFVTVYPPPGEVEVLQFTDHETLVWTPEASTGDYNLYRGSLGTLADLTYGGCEASNIEDATTTDADAVPPGDGFFYLVTAENLIDEEGTKGYSSAAVEHPNPEPCP